MTVAIILQETYQKHQALGLYGVLAISVIYRSFKEVVMVFLKVWLCPQAGFVVLLLREKGFISSGLILTEGAYVFQLSWKDFLLVMTKWSHK